MKVVFTVTLEGTEFAVDENICALISTVEPLILDKCDIQINTYSEEEFNK